MLKINRAIQCNSRSALRLALTFLFAGSCAALSATPVRAGAGDFLGGVGVGVILNEAMRGGGGSSNRGSSREHRGQRQHNNRGSRSAAPSKPRYTEQHKTQQALTDLGYYNGAIDGADGANIRAAISQYQAAKSLPQTGVLTTDQRNLMIAEAELQKSRIYLGEPNGIPLPDRDQNKRIQAALQVLGHYTGSIDGIMGRGSARAIASYQRDEGAAPSGKLSAEQEQALVTKAHENLNQRLADINSQFELMTGRPVATVSPALAGGSSTAAVSADQGNFSPIEALKEGLTPKRKYDVAVVIGNRSYSQKDIPDVAYGDRDAKAMRAILINDMGFDPENVIWAENATQAEMRAIFGSESNIKGKLWRYIEPDESNVFVYYSGHGAPDVNSSTPYLLPVDTDPNAIALNGYSLDLMYKNLSKLPVKSVAVMLDACFSGGSHEGMLIKSASPVMVSSKMPKEVADKKLTVLAAADGDELASWDEEKGHGIFTAHLLSGLKGEADTNGDKKVTARELHEYVSDGVHRQARRKFGREQTPKLLGDPDRVVGLVE